MRELLRLLAAPLAVLLAGYPLTLSTDARVLALSALALGACINALVLWSDGAVSLAVVAIVGAYAGGLYIGDVGLDPFAPLLGAGLLVLVDVCDTALAVPPERPVDRAVLRALLGSVGRSVGLAVAGGVVVLAAATLLTSGGPALRALAMAGVLVAVGGPVLLARRG